MTTAYRVLRIAGCAGIAVLVIGGLLTQCSNNPHSPEDTFGNTLLTSFGTPPTWLEPCRAYYVHEGRVIDQIYEPPFTYHYLKRPYELIPLTAEEVPRPEYFDADGNRLTDPDPPVAKVARAEYTIRIRRGIMYQNHPCFAKDENGNPRYGNVRLKDIKKYRYPSEFDYQGTRELTAYDYALQVRRLADPQLHCPIFATLAPTIMGMEELQDAYAAAYEAERERRAALAAAGDATVADEKHDPILLDYMAPDFAGVEVIDDYTYKIVLKRKYPQILYWMCMHFFAPMPREALDFYAQPAMVERQFSINRCPVGTGPYYLSEYLPNQRMVFEANTNYHEDRYPTEGNPGDLEAGLLEDAGKRLPFVTRQIWTLEKEGIPAWRKFRQGYTDSSGIGSDVFDQAVTIRSTGESALTDEMKEQGVTLVTDVGLSIWYTLFNMKDPVVGGPEPEKCKLRQAISIVIDVNEYLAVFVNGRGIPAQGPIPPGIFGRVEGEEGINTYVNDWDSQLNQPVRKSLEHARQLMVEAGYPGGIDPETGKPLVLYLDCASAGRPTFRSRLEWTKGKLALIGIDLRERDTDLSQFREKRLSGNWQISGSGWLADYPDPENFLFLFYGPNGLVDNHGANTANYVNEEYDELFRKMETMANGPERLVIVEQMTEILQRDCPAVWEYHPVDYGLRHAWYRNQKSHQMSYNTARYARIDGELRAARQREWNKPIYWPVLALLALIIAGTVPGMVIAYRRERGI